MKTTTICLLAIALMKFSLADTITDKVEDRLQRAAEDLQQITNAPDKGIPEEVMKSAKCIAVIPHVSSRQPRRLAGARRTARRSSCSG
jgi:lipid-binding SYLF domain-containing protein